MATTDRKEKNRAADAVRLNDLLDAVLDLTGDNLSYIIGDTFIEFKTMPPSEQWKRIVHLLAKNGFFIKRI